MKFNPATFDQVCPKFTRCNAAYCPAFGGKHLSEDSVCAWLREVVKAGGEERVKARIPQALYEVVLADAKTLLAGESDLSNRLLRASRTASQIALGELKAANLAR